MDEITFVVNERLRTRKYTITDSEHYTSDGPFFPQSRDDVKRVAVYREMQNMPYHVYKLDKEGFIIWDVTVIFRHMAKDWCKTYEWYLTQITRED